MRTSGALPFDLCLHDRPILLVRSVVLSHAFLLGVGLVGEFSGTGEAIGVWQPADHSSERG